MVLADIFGTQGLILLIIIIVVLFGGSQLPKLARNIGTAGKEFRKAQEEAEAEAAAKQTVVTPEATPVVPQPVTAGAETDKVTLSKAELEQLLSEREERAKRESSGPLN